MTLLVVILVVVWFLAGACGFYYWWTYEHETLAPDGYVAMPFGVLLGPLAWVVGWMIHGGRPGPHRR